MIRAVLFDFYGVWTPDRFSQYISEAAQQDQNIALQLRQVVDKYYLGMTDIDYVANNFVFKLNRADVTPEVFKLRQADISPALIDFIRYLHGHFLKLGVLADIGKQEFDLLNSVNADYQLFEVITGSLNVGGSVLTQPAFVKALQDIGEPPQSCLAVTGSDEYQSFAESCGMTALRFQGFPHLKQSMNQLIETA